MIAVPSSRRLIASQTLSTTAASVTFSSIPTGYRDLVLRWSNRYSTAADYTNVQVTFNGTTTTYSDTTVAAFAGSSTFSGRRTGQAYIDRIYVAGANTTANTFASAEIYIPNYTVSTNKPLSGFSTVENNSSTVNIIAATAGLWSNTSAITSIGLSVPSGTFDIRSSFYLYGLLEA